MTQDTYALTEHAAGFLARRIWAAEVEDLPEPLREVLRQAVAELVEDLGMSQCPHHCDM